MDVHDRKLAFWIAGICSLLFIGVWITVEFAPPWSPPPRKLSFTDETRLAQCQRIDRFDLPAFPHDLPMGTWCIQVKQGEVLTLRPTHTLTVWHTDGFHVVVDILGVQSSLLERQTIRSGSDCVKQVAGHYSTAIKPQGPGLLWLQHRPTNLPIGC